MGRKGVLGTTSDWKVLIDADAGADALKSRGDAKIPLLSSSSPWKAGRGGTWVAASPIFLIR